MAYPIKPRSPRDIILAREADFIEIELEKFCLNQRQGKLVDDPNIQPEARYQILVRTFELALIESLVELEDMPKSQLTFSHYGVSTKTGQPTLKISWTPDSADESDKEFTKSNITTQARAKGAVLASNPFTHKGYATEPVER